MSMNDVRIGLGLRCSPFVVVFLPLFLSLLCVTLLFYALHFCGAIDYLFLNIEQFKEVPRYDDGTLDTEDSNRR